MYQPHQISKKTFNEVCDKLDLPEAGAAAYLLTYNRGRMLLLEDYGLVIRIDIKDRDKAPAPEHDLILKPLKTFEHKDAVVSILPAVKILDLGKNALKTAGKLKSRLADDGIHYWDVQVENTGLIYSKSQDKKVAIVLDRDAIKPLDSFARTWTTIRQVFAGKAKRNTAENGLQDIFAPLTRKLEQGLKDGNLEDFYIAAKAMKDEGTLVCGWQDSPQDFDYSKTNSAKQRSRTYAPHVRKHHKRKFGFSF